MFIPTGPDLQESIDPAKVKQAFKPSGEEIKTCSLQIEGKFKSWMLFGDFAFYSIPSCMMSPLIRATIDS